MPSSTAQKVYKAKSILKPRSGKKAPKPDKNKENKVSNVPSKEAGKVTSKPKSLIPKISSKPATCRNSRKGEYQKYIVESREREKSIPTKISSRKSSVNSKIPKPKKKEVSKTELLYQKARDALEKSKRPPGTISLFTIFASFTKFTRNLNLIISRDRNEQLLASASLKYQQLVFLILTDFLN